MNLEPEIFYLLGSAGVGVVMTVVLRWRAWTRRSRWRAQRATAIADATDGVVVVIGTARRLANSPRILAPITGRECLAYEVEIIDRSSNFLRRLAAESRCATFLLEDGTGAAIVQLELASQDGPRVVEGELQLTADVRATAGGSEAPSPAVEELLRRHNIEFGFWSGRLCREAVLLEGATIAVRGRARRTTDPDPQHVDEYRQAPTRLLVVGDAETELWISDTPSIVPR